MNTKVIDLIKKFHSIKLKDWNEAISISEEFLPILLSYEIEDIFPRMCIRYLMVTKCWPAGMEVSNKQQWADVLNKFFSTATTGSTYVPVDYLKLTKQMILETFQYEIVELPASAETSKNKKTSKIKKKSMSESIKEIMTSDEGESGSKIFKSISETENE